MRFKRFFIVVLGVCIGIVLIFFSIQSFSKKIQITTIDHSISSSDNSSIDLFVKNAQFPESNGYTTLIDNKDNDVQVFKLSYGKPNDCPAGCFYSEATGLKYKNKIGWISISNYDKFDISKLTFFDFEKGDSYLYSDQFMSELKEKDDRVYQNSYLALLAKDKDVPVSVLLGIAEVLDTYIEPNIAETLLKNSAVQNNKEILEIISKLPVYRGDAYGPVRAKAAILLNQIK